MNRKLFVAWLVALFLLVASGLCLAEDKAPPKDLPDTPKDVPAGKRTAVGMEHVGTDDLGARLAFHLKEVFNKSSLFDLDAKDGKKIRLILSTREEFGDRPGLGSVYSAVWVYSESEDTLKYYLAGSVGLVSSNSVADTAEVLAGETAKITAKYSYLFDQP